MTKENTKSEKSLRKCKRDLYFLYIIMSSYVEWRSSLLTVPIFNRTICDEPFNFYLPQNVELKHDFYKVTQYMN